MCINYAMTTYETNDAFPFKKMILSQPQSMQGGGSYFTKLTIDDSPILLQLPRCNMKSGIVKTKRITYCDLMYDVSTYEEHLSSWVESLEETCQNLIDTKKHLWFSNELSRDDLETMMASAVRLYRSGTKALMRTYIDTSRRNGEVKCHIYDENERILDESGVSSSSSVIPLIQIEGIKFTARSFDIELKLVQLMVLEKEEPKMSLGCMIRRKNNRAVKDDDDSSSKSSENKSEKSSSSIQSGSILTKSEASDLGETTLENIEVSDEPLTKPKEVEISLGNLGLEEVNINTVNLENAEVDMEDKESLFTEDESVSSMTTDMSEVDNNVATGLEDVSNEVEIEIKDLTTNDIQEVELDVKDNSETITLKKPNEVYYEIYRAAREKARHMRKVALEAYLEAKQIKTKYMLEDLGDSDEEFDFTDNEISGVTSV